MGAASCALGCYAHAGEITRAFRSISAIAIHRQLGHSGQPVWQRDYHDRIVRNEREYEAIAAYVFNNPAQWECDRENPARISTGAA
jgi:putative transposase